MSVARSPHCFHNAKQLGEMHIKSYFNKQLWGKFGDCVFIWSGNNYFQIPAFPSETLCKSPQHSTLVSGLALLPKHTHLIKRESSHPSFCPTFHKLSLLHNVKEDSSFPENLPPSVQATKKHSKKLSLHHLPKERLCPPKTEVSCKSTTAQHMHACTQTSSYSHMSVAQGTQIHSVAHWGMWNVSID